jgi:hypothetical protein
MERNVGGGGAAGGTAGASRSSTSDGSLVRTSAHATRRRRKVDTRPGDDAAVADGDAVLGPEPIGEGETLQLAAAEPDADADGAADCERVGDRLAVGVADMDAFDGTALALALLEGVAAADGDGHTAGAETPALAHVRCSSVTTRSAVTARTRTR